MRTRSTCNNISPAVTDHSPRSISCSKTKTTSSEAAQGNERKENMSTNATKSAPKKRRRKHKVASREEWITARKKLLEAEKNLTRRSDKVARQRQKLPWVRIDKEYQFETDEGSASLPDLFQGRSQLLVYHFMFGYGYRLTDERRGCTGCSLIADHFDAVIPHLNGRDVTLVCESIAPLEELQDYKRQMAGVSHGFRRLAA